MSIVYSPPDELPPAQLAAVRRSHPELFLCAECGIDMRIPDLICGFCACTIGGEEEPELPPAASDPVSIAERG